MARSYDVTPNGRGAYKIKKSSSVSATIVLFLIVWAATDALIGQTWGTVVTMLLLALALIGWIGTKADDAKRRREQVSNDSGHLATRLRTFRSPSPPATRPPGHQAPMAPPPSYGLPHALLWHLCDGPPVDHSADLESGAEFLDPHSAVLPSDSYLSHKPTRQFN